MEPGSWIRSVREELLIKPSDVERISRSIAAEKGSTDFYISHSTLADIEAGSVPGIHKLFSLAVCLRLSFQELLLPFGINPEDLSPSQTESGKESFVPTSISNKPRFRFQLNFDVNYSNKETNLLRLSTDEIGHLPSFCRATIDPVRYRYASIGTEDDSMSDLLPPSSLVEIDTAQNTVQVFPWQTIRDRPVYLVWHTDGHSCCWCQVDGRELTLLPHPLSRQPVRRFKMPGQALVVGRVINAWLPLGSSQLHPRPA